VAITFLRLPLNSVNSQRVPTKVSLTFNRAILISSEKVTFLIILCNCWKLPPKQKLAIGLSDQIVCPPKVWCYEITE
jgi:hypothetical protein